ncbi:MAG: hypothetical protein K5924_06435 [Chloroflexi bacterium]|nr:hypothetical protein [Chloroflexota bacterium]
MSAGDRVVLDTEPVPGVPLRIRGDGAVVDHFRREYGSGDVIGGAAPALDVTFGAAPAGATPPTIVGRHKTVGWKVWPPRPQTDDPAMEIMLSGRPRWFALSLVQGYIVEPMLSLAAARRRSVLLPAAAIASPNGAAVLVGRSRTGKSSVCAMALANGHAVLGDDQVVIDASGVSRFPRRMRFYDDLERTAPSAFRRLTATHRASLLIRRVVRIGTRGLVAPSLAVPAEDLGQVAWGPLPATRVFWIERGAKGDALHRRDLSLDELLDASSAILAAQRQALGAWTDQAPSVSLRAIGDGERATLAAAFADASLERLAIPDAWDASRSVREVARVVGVAS